MTICFQSQAIGQCSITKIFPEYPVDILSNTPQLLQTLPIVEAYLRGNREVNVQLVWSLNDGRTFIEGTTRDILLRPGDNRLALGSHTPPYQVIYSRQPTPASSSSSASFCVWIAGSEEQTCAGVPLNTVSFTPPRLVYPFDQEELEIQNPSFSWLPVAPLPPGGVEYRIRIVELVSHQNGQAAISSNLAFFEQVGLSVNLMPYPAFAESFDTTAVYAWQVQAFSRQTGSFLGNSETWEFSFSEPDSMPEDPPESVVIADLQENRWTGSYSAYQNKIGFRFKSLYPQEPRLMISGNKDGKTLELSSRLLVEKSPDIYMLSIPSNFDLKKGQLYTLTVRGAGNERAILRFEYRGN